MDSTIILWKSRLSKVKTRFHLSHMGILIPNFKYLLLDIQLYHRVAILHVTPFLCILNGTAFLDTAIFQVN